MLVWPIKAVINCFVGFWSCASISIFGFVPGFLHIFRRCAGIFAFCFLEIWQCPDFSELCYRPCPASSRRRERGERKSFIFRCNVGNRFLRLFIGFKKMLRFLLEDRKGREEESCEEKNSPPWHWRHSVWFPFPPSLLQYRQRCLRKGRYLYFLFSLLVSL